MFSWNKKKFFCKKKLKWTTQKTEIFKITNSQNFVAKILWIGLLNNSIDWCKGHWCGSIYMVMRLSEVSSKHAKSPFFGCFWAYVGQPHDHIPWAKSMPFASINTTNTRSNPWNFHENFSRIGGFKKLTFLIAHFEIFLIVMKRVTPAIIQRKPSQNLTKP